MGHIRAISYASLVKLLLCTIEDSIINSLYVAEWKNHCKCILRSRYFDFLQMWVDFDWCFNLHVLNFADKTLANCQIAQTETKSPTRYLSYTCLSSSLTLALYHLLRCLTTRCGLYIQRRSVFGQQRVVLGHDALNHQRPPNFTFKVWFDGLTVTQSLKGNSWHAILCHPFHHQLVLKSCPMW